MKKIIINQMILIGAGGLLLTSCINLTNTKPILSAPYCDGNAYLITDLSQQSVSRYYMLPDKTICVL